MRKRLRATAPVLCALAALLLISLPAAAHHVHHVVARGDAVVVSLTYGNGSPLTFDRYDIFAGGEESPFQSGTTDAAGRIVFLPDRSCTWRVKVFSEDGHGADFTFQAGPVEPAVAEPDGAAPAGEAADPAETVQVALTPGLVAEKPFIERFAGPVAGVGIIFGIFGLFALFFRRR